MNDLRVRGQVVGGRGRIQKRGFASTQETYFIITNTSSCFEDIVLIYWVSKNPSLIFIGSIDMDQYGNMGAQLFKYHCMQ